MEQLNKKTLSFPAKYFTRAFAALGMALALVACGKDGGGSGVNTNINTNIGWNCLQQTCGTMTAPTVLTSFTSTAADGSLSLQNMQLIGQSNLVTNTSTGSIYKWYQGPVAAQGTLVVNKPIHDYVPYTGQLASNCVIPPGSYPIQTRTLGTMEFQGVNILLPELITTTGSVVLRVEAPAQEGMGLYSSGQKLLAIIRVVSANGIACSQHLFGTFN